MAGAYALAGGRHSWSTAVAIARIIAVASASTASVEVGTYGVKAFEAPWRDQPRPSSATARRRLVRQEQDLMLEPDSKEDGTVVLVHGHTHAGRHRHRTVDEGGIDGDPIEEANDQLKNDELSDGITAWLPSTTHPADKYGLGPGAPLDPYNVPQAVIGVSGPVGLQGSSGDVAVPEAEEEGRLRKLGATLDALQGKATYVSKGMVKDLLCLNAVLCCCVFGALYSRLRSKQTPASEAAGGGLHFSIDVSGLQDAKLQENEEMRGAIQGAIASAIAAEADGLADFGDISVDVVGPLEESENGVQFEVVIGCSDAEGLQMKLGSSGTIYETITQSVQGVEGILEVAEGEVQVSNIGEIGLLS